MGMIAGDDDGDGVEDGPLHIVRGGADHIPDVEVLFPVARGEFAEDILHHDHRAIHDDAEIDGADGEQIGRECGANPGR